MGTAAIVATIGLGAALFMLWFLFALLREGPPSVCYWSVPVGWKARETLQVWSVRHEDDSQNGLRLSDGRADLLENQNHAEYKYDSGLILLDVRTISGELGWRAIRPRRNPIFTERRR
ncbi:MAG: hypothetical protein WAL56_22140 [Candidatus Sulfotelmatobacter sp.]